MRRTEQKQAEKPLLPFTVSVDGKVFGPFPGKDRERFRYLDRRKGVEIKHVPLSSLSLSLSLSPKRKKQKEEHPSLLDGTDFVPTGKVRYQGF